MNTKTIVLIAAIVLSPALAAVVRAGDSDNLLINGSFDDKDNPLKGWRYKYDLPGETQWYGQNHLYVFVVPAEDGRKGVLKLHGTQDMMAGAGQGVKVDSDPIPFKFGEEYEISLWMKTTGPDCIIRIQGYEWKPGVRPHPNPTFGELREAYKSKPLRIEAKEYVFAGVPRTWKQGHASFPMKNASELSLKHLHGVDFVAVHLCAISGGEGDLFIDDVVLKLTKDAPSSKP